MLIRRCDTALIIVTMYRYLHLKFYVLLCAVNFICYAPAQQIKSYELQKNKDRLMSYVCNIENFNRYFPQEKVYLHFDNTGYFMDETIWFKAYIIRADTRHWTDLSEVLYVELLNPSGDVIDTQKLHIKDGQAEGCIELKNLFASGFYEVRAYTRYMLNWDAACIFSRVFPVFNTPQTEGDYSKRILDKKDYRKRLPDNRETDSLPRKKISVRFYPEGGHLIKGLCSRMAFEIIDQNGMGVDTTATLYIGNQAESMVQTVREGRGVFDYTPSEEQAYMTVMGQDFALPQPLPDGCVMTVRQDETWLTINISRSEDVPQSLGLVLMNGGNVDAFDVISFKSGEKENGCRFNRHDMNEGVNQMVLIDSCGNILSERMFFIYPTNQDTINLTVSKTSVSPYGKISLCAKTLPQMVFSLSVRDWQSETNGNDQNVATWLLLSSDLKGYIHNPKYYLEKDDYTHRQAVDLLMMTQGWRRYDVTQMEGRKTFFKRHPIEDRLYMYGRIRPVKKKQTVNKITLRATLYNKFGQVLKGSGKTDSAGYYAFRLPDCEGEWTTLFETSNSGKMQNYRVLVDRQFSPKPRFLAFYEQQTLPLFQPLKLNWAIESDSMMERLSIDKRNHLLPEIKVKGHGLFENARAGWESEKRGAYRAILRYDMTKEADALADKGIEKDNIFDFLRSRNNFFAGSIDNLNLEITEKMDNSIESIISKLNPADVNAAQRKKRPNRRLFFDGLTYKNRPVIWILDNCYSCATGVPEFAMDQTEGQVGAIIYQESHEAIPDDLEDFKSVYISEDENIWKRYAYFPALSGLSPVTVFLYTYHDTPAKQRGTRHTNFIGYSKTETFKMPDYSKLPPMPDYRRTLYWNPDVKTDSNGEAKIEFYNNSTCRQLVISAEGITKDGRAVVNR